jgi:hypothetical protein
MSTRFIRIFGLIVVLISTGCTSLKQFRTSYIPCVCSNADYSNCKDATIEEHKSDNFSLSFVEFDDQGSLWDRRQLDTVINNISSEGKKPNGLLMVAFIHGWKNNARYDNGNVASFRESLRQLARLEAEAAKNAKPPVPARKVLGLYVGWRGLSVDDYVVNQLTFWDRKNTAERVGHGAVTEFLVQLEDASTKAKEYNKNTDFVIVGHSFGGLILYSALSQILTERMSNPVNTYQGFADLIVMLNPAIEAARFTPLQQLAAAKGYDEGHFPSLAIITSQGDWATKKTFKIGRWFSTFLETYRDDVQQEENITAVGHFQPYITHELIPRAKAKYQGIDVWDEKFSWEETASQDGYAINFKDAQLVHKDDAQHRSAPQNPIMVISVDKQIISDHNDIFNETLLSFLADLIVSKPQN